MPEKGEHLERGHLGRGTPRERDTWGGEYLRRGHLVGTLGEGDPGEGRYLRRRTTL